MTLSELWTWIADGPPAITVAADGPRPTQTHATSPRQYTKFFLFAARFGARISLGDADADAAAVAACHKWKF